MSNHRRKNEVAQDAEKPNSVSTEEANRVLDEERRQRMGACRLEIQQVLQKHRCAMLAEVKFRQGAQAPIYNILVLPEP